jgi:hypothetical protein
MARGRAPIQPDVDDPPATAPARPPKRERDDVDRVMALLEWGRKRGFQIGPSVEVGTVKLMVRDLRPALREKLGDDQDDEEHVPLSDIMAEHGAGADVPVEGTTG